MSPTPSHTAAFRPDCMTVERRGRGPDLQGTAVNCPPVPQAIPMSHIEGDLRAPEGARFAIIASRWNPRISDALLAGARKAFAEHGVDEGAIDVVRVPGAWEIPVAAARIAAGGAHRAIVALGCVVRGDTRHFEHVADRCAEGLMRASLDHLVPVANGVLAVDDPVDAERRAGGSHGNKGEECALVAIEMAQLWERLP